MLKLHVGCGDVYLEGYVNIHPAPYGLASFYPEEVEKNKTTVDKYYKDEFGCKNKKHIADVKACIDDLPTFVSSSSVDEICMFHVLEHIPQYDLHKTLNIIVNLLKPNGCFRVAVPDFDAIVIEYANKLNNQISESDKEWYFRYVYGTQKDQWSHHYCGYNYNRLTKLLGVCGFNAFQKLPNQNCYPAIHLLAYKGVD